MLPCAGRPVKPLEASQNQHSTMDLATKLDSLHDELRKRVNSALLTIRRALALYSQERLAFSFNGGVQQGRPQQHLNQADYMPHCTDRLLQAKTAPSCCIC